MMLRNTKHEQVAQRLASGQPQETIERELHYAQGYVSRLLSKNLQIRDRICELGQRVQAETLWNATKLLLRLGEQAEADICEIRTAEGDFKPVEDWPLHWRRMIQAIEYEEQAVRSHDGVQAGDSKAWDKTGTRIVKIKFIDRLKNLELLGRHRAIDAFVSNANAKDIAGEVMSEIDKRIAEGRERAARALPSA